MATRTVSNNATDNNPAYDIDTNSGVVNDNTQRVVLASDVNAPVNLAQVGAADVTLGQKTKANSIPVTLPSDLGTLTVQTTGISDVQVNGPVLIQDSFGNNIETDGAGNLKVTSTNLGVLISDSAGFPLSSTAGALDVNLASSGATLPVSGTFWQATQPVSLASVPSHPVTVTKGTSTTFTAVSVSGNTALATADATRVECTIYNTHATASLLVAYGFTATLANYSVPVGPGGYLEVPEKSVGLAINAIASTGTITANVTKVT